MWSDAGYTRIANLSYQPSTSFSCQHCGAIWLLKIRCLVHIWFDNRGKSNHIWFSSLLDFTNVRWTTCCSSCYSYYKVLLHLWKGSTSLSISISCLSQVLVSTKFKIPHWVYIPQISFLLPLITDITLLTFILSAACTWLRSCWWNTPLSFYNFWCESTGMGSIGEKSWGSIIKLIKRTGLYVWLDACAYNIFNVVMGRTLSPL